MNPVEKPPAATAATAAAAASASAGKSMTADLDPLLHNMGFEIDYVSPSRVTGRLIVTESCCQPFKVLHGGMSAMVAEALASIGAHVASGFRRVAGIQLSINHHRSAPLGDHVFAEATPLQLGRTIQVWEVQLWKLKDETEGEKGSLLSSARVTLLANMPVPEHAKQAEETLRRYAKL